MADQYTLFLAGGKMRFWMTRNSDLYSLVMCQINPLQLNILNTQVQQNEATRSTIELCIYNKWWTDYDTLCPTIFGDTRCYVDTSSRRYCCFCKNQKDLILINWFLRYIDRNNRMSGIHSKGSEIELHTIYILWTLSHCHTITWYSLESLTIIYN